MAKPNADKVASLATDIPTPAIGRIPIRNLSPQQPENRWPAKSFVDEVVPFRATVFREGHDLIGVQLLLTDPSGVEQVHRMVPTAPGTDGWTADAQLTIPGTWTWRVRAFTDDWHTWQHNAELKIPAGVDVDLMFTMADQLLDRAGSRKIFTNARQALAEFRSATSSVRHDPAMTELVALLTEESPDFAAWWPEHDVSGFETRLRRFSHPAAGELTFEYQQLTPAEWPNLRVVAQLGVPGDDSAARLAVKHYLV